MEDIIVNRPAICKHSILHKLFYDQDIAVFKHIVAKKTRSGMKNKYAFGNMILEIFTNDGNTEYWDFRYECIKGFSRVSIDAALAELYKNMAPTTSNRHFSFLLHNECNIIIDNFLSDKRIEKINMYTYNKMTINYRINRNLLKTSCNKLIIDYKSYYNDSDHISNKYLFINKQQLADYNIDLSETLYINISFKTLSIKNILDKAPKLLFIKCNCNISFEEYPNLIGYQNEDKVILNPMHNVPDLFIESPYKSIKVMQNIRYLKTKRAIKN